MGGLQRIKAVLQVHAQRRVVAAHILDDPVCHPQGVPGNLGHLPHESEQAALLLLQLLQRLVDIPLGGRHVALNRRPNGALDGIQIGGRR